MSKQTKIDYCKFINLKFNPVSKIAEKAVCRRVILTIRHCILSAELIKTRSFRLFFFLPILSTGFVEFIKKTTLLMNVNQFRIIR